MPLDGSIWSALGRLLTYTERQQSARSGLSTSAKKELNMAGQGGPDEETWNRITCRAKRIYWICIFLIFTIILILFGIRFFR
jgi:hypothetical protein